MSAAAELLWRPNVADESLHRLFASAPLCIAQLDLTGTIKTVNPALRQLLATSHELELSGLAALIDSRDVPECERLLREMLEGRRNCFEVETRSRAHNLRLIRWTMWRVSGGDSPDFVLAMATAPRNEADNGNRLRQRTQLESVGRLAAGVVHDFNNLLSGILLYCDLLLVNVQPQNTRKYAQEIRSSAMQAAALARQLLNLARPAMLQPRLLCLNEVVEALHELLSRLIGTRIRLQLRLDPKLGSVRLDYTQAQQIVLNLVLNARDAMPEGGEIAIETKNGEVEIFHHRSVETRLPCVLLVISDNGIGMDAATRARMFEAFFTTKGNNGTGLGLAGVYDIVHASGGLIHVNTAPGSGTRVSVLLPIAADSHTCSEITQERSEPQNGATTTGEVRPL